MSIPIKFLSGNREARPTVYSHQEDPSKVVLRSENRNYDDMDVAINDICALYVVERIINIQDCV